MPLRFPAPGSISEPRGTIEFWAKLTNAPNNLFDGIGLLAAPAWPPLPSLPWAHWRLGFGANDGCGGSGFYGTAGVSSGSCWQAVETATNSGTLDSILHDRSAWHHYAITWDLAGITALGGRKVYLFIDGTVVNTSYYLDRSPWESIPEGQTFALAYFWNASGMSVAVDNLISWDDVRTDFSDTMAYQSPIDYDEDDIPNGSDNCPTTPNPGQEDIDRDGIGNLCDADFNTIAPELVLPLLDPFEATGPSGAVVVYTVTATDDDDPDPDVVCSPESGTLFALGETTVSCSATDTSGNVDSDSFAVSVVDTTAPELTLPADLAVEGNASGGGNVMLAEAFATDIVDTHVTAECTPASGYFTLGDHAITCVASDVSGNASSGSYTLTVQDTTPPTLSLPAIFVSEGNTAGGANLTLPTVTAVDVVDGSPRVICERASGFFALGETSVSCSAQDASGNASNGSYLVQVVDTDAPFVQMRRVSAPQFGWLPAETKTSFPARVGAEPVALEVRALDVVGIHTVTIEGLLAEGGPEFWNLSGLGLIEGTNWLTALATDLGGNNTALDGQVVLTLDLDGDFIRNDVDEKPKQPSYDFSDRFNTGLGRGPIDVAVSPDGDHAYVANYDSGSVSVIDTDTLALNATVNVGGRPWAVAVSPDGSCVYVTNTEGRLSVIDTFNNAVVANPNLSGNLHSLAVHPDGHEVYVTNSNGYVYVLNAASNQWVRSIGIGGPAVWDALEINADGSKLVVGLDQYNVVRVMDTAAGYIHGSSYLGDIVRGVALHPTSGDIYVGRWNTRTLAVLTPNLSWAKTIALGSCTPINLAFTPGGEQLYVTCYGNPGKLAVIDPSTGSVTRSIPLERPDPRATAFNPDGSVAYTAQLEGNALAIIDARHGWVLDQILSNATAGTSYGKIATLGDQFGALKIEDLETPFGVDVSTDASGGARPAIINPCGTTYEYIYSADTSYEVYCGSAGLHVKTGTVEVAFETPEGAQGHAVVGAGNGLILDPPVSPIDPPFTIQAPETNQSPVVVEINGEQLVLEPGATPSTFSDGDGIPDELDNCPTVANQDQMDANHDSFGDACVPLSVSIAKNVSIAQPIVIGNGTSIAKDSRIGSGAIIGDDASIDKTFSAGDNLRIGDRARVDKEATLGNNVSLGAEVNIDKGARISHSVMIGDRTRMAKSVQIGEASVIGADCNIGQQVRIGERVVIGDGAVVPSRAVVPDGTLIP